MKEELKNLTPAEILLIINPAQPSLGELLRVTVFDLASRGVIKITQQGISQLSHEVQLLKHEKLLVDEILYNPTEIDELSERLKKSLRSGEEFMLKYVYSERLSNYFYSTFIQRIFGTKTLNEHGIILQNNLFELIDDTLFQLRKRTKRDEKKIADRMKLLGRNAILLDNIQSVDRILPKKERRHFYESYYFLGAVGLNLEFEKTFDLLEQLERGDSESIFSSSTETIFGTSSGFDTGGDGGED